MALSTTQIQQLDALKTKQSLGETDLKNLNYAATQGYDNSWSKAYNVKALDPNQQTIYVQPGVHVPGATLATSKPIVPTNVISSDTLNKGLSGTDIKTQLPSYSNAAQAAEQIYNQGTLSDAKQTSVDLQKQQDAIKAQQLKDAQLKLDQQQTTANQNIKEYNAGVQPAIDQFKTDLNNKANAMAPIYTQDFYSEQYKDKVALNEQIKGYSKLLNDQLSTSNQPGISSVINGNKNALIADYNAKISLANASMAAIDDNLGVASSTLDAGITKLNGYYDNKIKFQQLANSVIDDTEVKKLTAQAITDLQTKQKTLEATKTAILNLMSDPATAIASSKAGIALTDTPEQIATKMNNFYVKNPGYAPDNVAANKTANEKYPDAGITPYDTADVRQTKLNRSALYRKDTGGVILNPDGTPVVDVSNSTVDQIAEAIKQVESGGNYNAKGGSGESGAYQFMPGTWASWSADYSNQVLHKSGVLPMTPENQDAVAKWKIQTWLSQGLTPQQIAAKWNSGSEIGWENKIGVNSKGVSYNVPAYVNKVTNALSKITGNTNTSSTIDKKAADYIKGGYKISDIKGKDAAETAAITASYLKQKAEVGNISKSDAETTAKLQDKVNQIDDLISKVSTDGSGIIGPTWLARWSLGNTITGKEAAFAGSVHQLISKETLDTLINLKKNGGTLGALSDQERLMLQNAGSKLASWEVKDENGNGTGVWAVTEADFKKELQTIKTLTQRAIEQAGGSTGIVNTLEQKLSSNPAKIDEYNLLVKTYPGLTDDEYNQLLGE